MSLDFLGNQGNSARRMAPMLSFRSLQAAILARYEAAQIGRRNPHYVPSGNGLLPSAGNGLLPSTAAPTITVATTAPANLATTALPPTISVPSDAIPYIRPTPYVAAFRVGPQGYYCRTGTNNVLLNTTYLTDTGLLTAPMRWEFNTDDPKPTYEIQGTSTNIRTIVDDQYADLTGYQPDAANSGNTRYVTLDFTQGGAYTAIAATKTRNIKIETQGSCVVGRVIRSSVIYDVFSSPVGPRLAIVGDSWSQGIGAASPSDNLAACLADWMGISDFANNGVSGSGYLTPYPSSGPELDTYLVRLPDLVRLAPDIIIVTGLTNDISAFNSSTITEVQFVARINQYFQALRALFPATPIVVLSGSIPSQAMLAKGQALENDLKALIASMNALGDTRIAHVPTIVPSSGGPWIFGSGSDSVPTNDGNRDIYGSSASGAAQHLNAGGYNYFGKRAAREVVNAIRAMS